LNSKTPVEVPVLIPVPVSVENKSEEQIELEEKIKEMEEPKVLNVELNSETEQTETEQTETDLDMEFQMECPKVSHTDNSYYVNGRDYGKDKRVAREIYRINFPKCDIPNELDDWYNKEKPLSKDCPYIVDSPFNPCKFYACENVDWSKKTANEAGMNQACKRRVDAYCNEHAYLDEKCKPWRTEYRDLPENKEFRKQFLEPTEVSITDFNIEDHPDSKYYIRKDRIPVWGSQL